MGSGIAAQMANSRIEVLLLDIPSANSNNKNELVLSSYNKLLASKPEALLHPDLQKYITIGNLEDDISKVSQCDLIIEVIVEKLDVKHDLYNKLVPYIKDTAILSSNTSTIPLHDLTKSLPEGLKKRFFITHFFNPPRYMALLELVSGKDADASLKNSLESFFVHKLGKTVIFCNDTPGFIANRVGCFLLELVVRKAILNKLDLSLIDKIFTKFLYFPSTAIAGLYDLIGHDVMSLISDSLISVLDKNDAYQRIYVSVPALDLMYEKKMLGRKSGGGFYRKSSDNQQEVLDLNSMEYKPKQDHELPESFEEFMARKDVYSKFIIEILDEFYKYVKGLVPSVTANGADIDLAMKLGYSFKYGPFELMEKKLFQHQEIKEFVLKNAGPILGSDQNQSVAVGAKEKRVVDRNDSVVLSEYDNHYKLCLLTKAGTLNHEIFNFILRNVSHIDKKLLITSNSSIFCAGANLQIFYDYIKEKDWYAVEDFLSLGQNALLALKNLAHPVIAVAGNAAFGGGTELLLHADYIVGHQNLRFGLVEVGVGLIPGWGGVKECFARAKDADSLLVMLKAILYQTRYSSPEYLNSIFGAKAIVNMNFAFAEEEALALAVEKKPQNSSLTSIDIPYIDLEKEFDFSKFENTQRKAALFFQRIIDLKQTTHQQILALEREQLHLCAHAKDILEKIQRYL
jgi:3-hydroxyacyl-CoA dehydrogenase/enoyl-CoA hydratase/3-hydroxybutyryl-CoA epimerase